MTASRVAISPMLPTVSSILLSLALPSSLPLVPHPLQLQLFKRELLKVLYLLLWKSINSLTLWKNASHFMLVPYFSSLSFTQDITGDVTDSHKSYSL